MTLCIRHSFLRLNLPLTSSALPSLDVNSTRRNFHRTPPDPFGRNSKNGLAPDIKSTYNRPPSHHKYPYDGIRDTPYKKRMRLLSRTIFGEPLKPELDADEAWTMREWSSRPQSQNPRIVRYYPELHGTTLFLDRLRDRGMYANEHLDWKDEIFYRREKRGRTNKYQKMSRDKRDERRDKHFAYITGEETDPTQDMREEFKKN